MMASHNQTGKYVSTRRTFKVNKGNGQKVSVAGSTRSADVEERSRSTSKQNGTYQPTANQNYSSRNSLRAAQSTNNNFETSAANQSHLPFTMPKSIGEAKLQPTRCVEDSSSYMLLNSDCFIRKYGDFLICMLCGKRERMKGEDAVDQHVASSTHNLRLSKFRFSLLDKPLSDTSLQMTAISELLSSWYNSQLLSDKSIAEHFDVVIQLNVILARYFPETYCKVIGSFSSGTPLRGSDINVELVHPNSMLFEKDPRAKNSIHHKLVEPDAEFGQQYNNHALYFDLAPNAIDTMYKLIELFDNKYRDPPLNAFEVASSIYDLNGKVPRLVLRHVETQITVEVNCYVNYSSQLSTLLGIYMSLDERARILSILVKHWAKICGINKPEQGTFPPYAYVILVIYYLQRTSPPVLPCLHQLSQEGKLGSKQMNDFDLVRTTTEQLERLDLNNDQRDLDRKDDNQAAELFDPVTEANQDNLEMTDDVDQDDEEEEEFNNVLEEESLKNLSWKSANESSVTRLFVDFMKFYIKEFSDVESVISIRTLKRVSLHSRKWGTTVKAIENPIKPRVNFSRCIGTVRIADYIKNCFKFGFYYLTSIPVEPSPIQPKSTPEVSPEDFTSIYFNYDRLNTYFHYKEKMIKTIVTYDSIGEMINQNLFGRDVEVINSLFDKAEKEGQTLFLPAYVAQCYNKSLLLPRDINCTTFCWLCRRSGAHTRSTCPQGKLDNLRQEARNYDTSLDNKANFDSDFQRFYMKDKISPQLAQKHSEVISKIGEIIKMATGLKCRLQQFGSTVNNLGSFDSDLDICMTIQGSSSGKDVDCVAILGKVADFLKRVEEVTYVEPILTARVPIIKFKYESFDIDLSMYNECAIFNSKLMKTYSEIDYRVGLLFYLVKRYAKACGIADATRGSLSSYAWSLLVIHYLQNTEPPILPVLQEPPDDHTKGSIGVNGWNVWFESNPKLYSMQPNRTNITQLFKGFFLYYGNFDFNFFVVSIRKKDLMTRFQKSWNNCIMAIEDPFELTYNLASRLDDLMAIYIINSFSQAYMHLLTIQQCKIRGYSNSWCHNTTQTMKKIFNGRDITGCKPPYRGCRICHKIGHKLIDCPNRPPPKNRKEIQMNVRQ